MFVLTLDPDNPNAGMIGWLGHLPVFQSGLAEVMEAELQRGRKRHSFSTWRRGVGSRPASPMTMRKQHRSNEVRRREFLAASGQTVMLALAAATGDPSLV